MIIDNKKKPMSAFYAVKIGRNPGIYYNWDDARQQVDKFSNAQYKKFSDMSDAFAYLIAKSDKLEQSDLGSLTTTTTTNHQTSMTFTNNSNLSPNRLNNKDLTSHNIVNSGKRKLGEISSANKLNNFANNEKLPLYSKEDEKKLKLTDEETNATKSNPISAEKPKIPRSSPSKSKFAVKDIEVTSFSSSSRKVLKYDNTSKKELSINITNPSNQIIKSNDTHINIFLSEFETKKTNFTFNYKPATVWTDGACSNNGYAKATAGVGVFWGMNHPLNVSKKLNGLQTNNRAEIAAACVAITQAITHEASEVNINTDSIFIINCSKNWITNWKKNGWRTTNGDVKNQDDVKKLDELCSKIKVNWKHIEAHKGHFGNEEADKLARKGASS